jgi:Calx-beta domain
LASASTVSVTVSTVPGTALAGSDYQTTAATLTFAPGVTQRNFQVTLVNNNTAEPTEQFSVVLSSPSGATIADGTGIVTILDDDGALVATQAAPSAAGAEPLSAEDMSGALDSARDVWAQIGVDTSSLDGVSVEIVDLPGAMLGEADGTVIRLDVDAAGWGWTVSGGRIELVRVLAHELGHLLGFDHDDAGLYGVMAERLAPLEPARPVAQAVADQPRRIAFSRAAAIRALSPVRIAAPGKGFLRLAARPGDRSVSPVRRLR